jgi:hypothetical protein
MFRYWTCRRPKRASTDKNAEAAFDASGEVAFVRAAHAIRLLPAWGRVPGRQAALGAATAKTAKHRASPARNAATRATPLALWLRWSGSPSAGADSPSETVGSDFGKRANSESGYFNTPNFLVKKKTDDEPTRVVRATRRNVVTGCQLCASVVRRGDRTAATPAAESACPPKTRKLAPQMLHYGVGAHSTSVPSASGTSGGGDWSLFISI